VRPRPLRRLGVVEFHQGRLFDHIHLRVRDLDASRAFYRAVLGAVGVPLHDESESHFFADELFVSADGEPTEHLHIAFQAPDEETVQRFHEAGLAAGGTDNGRPGRQQRRGRLPRPVDADGRLDRRAARLTSRQRATSVSTTCWASSPTPKSSADLRLWSQWAPTKYSPGTSVAPRCWRGQPSSSTTDGSIQEKSGR
jgi:catechol 2,3-dioxygenase-like lactoylglutathione lyase family enzyme